MQDKEICPLCQRAGLIKYLKSYQINLDEAVVLCENKTCTYPLSLSTSLAATFSRKLDDVVSSRANEVKAKVPDSQLALQTKVASLIHKTGLHLQNDAIGIQTGSPQLKKKLKKNHIPHKKRETTAALPSQTGFNSYPSFQLQNGSHSFQTFKSFTETIANTPDATRGQSWTGCNGSEGISDKDSLLNSSGDSLESSSVSSSNSSLVDNLNLSNKVANAYQAFQFKGNRRQHLPNSLPNLSSLNNIHNGENIENNVINDKERTMEQVYYKTSDIITQSNDKGRTLNKVQKTNTTSQNQNNLEANSSYKVQNNVNADTVPEILEMPIFDKYHDCLLNTGAKSEKVTVDSHKNLLRYPSVFPQWRNRDALCWLDVILCLAVHNETLKSLVFCESFDKKNLICKLFQAHNQACKLVQESDCKPVLQKCEISGTEPDQTKEINDYSRSNVINQTQPFYEFGKENSSSTSVREGARLKNIKAADELLNGVREEVWNCLKCRLKCEKGQNESPVFAFPLLLKENPAVEEMFKMVYRFEYKCSMCGRVENTDHTNTLPTFPGVVKDFNIGDPKHSKKCLQCGNTADTRNMVYKNLPECLLMHFTEGIPDTKCEELQFGFHGYLYTVTGFVQYINKPDHFIAWLRSPHDNTWFRCDDRRPTLCQKRHKEPTFPCSQIHIVMWERLRMKSKICRQVAIDKDDSQPVEAQKLEKKAMLNLNFVNFPENDTQHSKIGSDTAFNILKQINKLNDSSSNDNKPQTSVKLLDSSPCSTYSAGSSDSLLLPNFIAFTTESDDVLRPIPMSVTNVVPATCNSNTVTSKLPVPLETRSVNAFECSEKNQGLKVDNTSKVDNLKVKLKVSGNNASDESEKMVENCQLNIPPSKISGHKSVIRPSTVFCVPKKSTEVDKNQPPIDVINSINKEVVNNNSEETGQVGETPILQGTSVQKEIDTSTDLKERNTDGSPYKDLLGNCEDFEKDSKNIINDSISEDNDGLKTMNRRKSSSRLSQRSRFKVPFNLNKKACLSRDAFLTLESNGKSRPSSSGDDTPVSATSSPALSGNITYLNSVKQYLLSRTTGRADPKFKFEGLNLKTSSSNSTFNLSEFGFPVSSCASSIRSEVPSECNSPSNCSDTLSMKNSSKTSELVNELIQRLEQSPFNQSTLKRKVENRANDKSPKKRVKESQIKQETLLNGNMSLKENTRTHQQRKLPGGKSMKLVRKLAHQAEKVNNEENSCKMNEEPLELNNQMLNVKTTKCDSESVLQDLYEALNIPFSSVDATMTDIMTDVGDILNFVNVDDLVPGQNHVNKPLSCFEGSSAENQKHSDCWLGRPDCNHGYSAQREMSYFRITHLFLK